MKIVLLDKSTLGSDVNLDIFNSLGDFITYETTSHQETLARLQDADIVITNKVIIDKNIIDNTNLKLICVSATGTNNIDMEYAKKMNIPVKNVSGYSTSSVAQLTISMVLYFVQHLNQYSNYVKSGKWEKSDIFTNIDFPFYELKNKNWGIIGLGNIGRKVADIASAFDCNVSYYSTSNTNYNTNYKMKDLETIIKESDILTIHSPLNEKTKDLIDYKLMKMMKKDAILVNVARGGIINEEDIKRIINEEHIYIALDSITIEPIQKESIINQIKSSDRILITPHIGWASFESRSKLIEGVYKNIEDFLRGE